MPSSLEATTKPTTKISPTLGWKGLLKFLIPSLFGISMFLVPISLGDQVTIGLGVMAEWLKSVLDGALPTITVAILCLSVVMTTLVKVVKPSWSREGVWHDIFDVSPVWFTLRILGALFSIMILYQVGPEIIWHPNTGGVMLQDLAPVLLTFFFCAALLLPFLVDFGFMEFIGALVSKPFRFIFRLPGRSAIDATASWLGSGTVGVLITAQQYEQGFYNRREAAVIATNFSVASIAFSLLITTFVGLNHMFVQFYFTVVVAGLIAAIIVPRLPPLSRKDNSYYEPVGCQINEVVPHNKGVFRHSLELAVTRAEQSPSAGKLAMSALSNVMDIFLALLPVVMAIGTLSLILAEYTPLFVWLSYPMIPLLELLQIPEAAAAAPATLVGFADMFLPAVLIKDIDSDLTRFVVACLSLTQLVYMSEVGVLLLKSKIPLNFSELLVIFLLRTLVTLPIIAIMAHLFFF